MSSLIIAWIIFTGSVIALYIMYRMIEYIMYRMIDVEEVNLSDINDPDYYPFEYYEVKQEAYNIPASGSTYTWIDTVRVRKRVKRPLYFNRPRRIHHV